LILPTVISRFTDLKRLQHCCMLFARVLHRLSISRFFTICSGVCRFRFFVIEFLLAILALGYSHNIWNRIRGAFQHLSFAFVFRTLS
jgi:hypothetical protein